MIVIGTTTRITHASPHGGVVFRLRPDNSLQTVRVRADYDVLRDAPGIGERVSVQGFFEQGHYGRQLIASAVRPEPASNASVHALLLENLAFSHIPTRAKQLLFERLGSQLLPAFRNGDVASLIEAGARFSVAHDLIAAWLEHSSTIATRRFLLDHGLSQRTASMAGNLWGIDAVDTVCQNPYRLLAVAPWEEVDAVATSTFHCAEDDERRYLGFADAVFNEAASRGRAALFASEFEQLVHSRIGNDADAKTIFSACIQGQRMKVVKTGRLQYIQGATLARIEAQIQFHLKRFLPSNANPPMKLHKRPQLSALGGLCDKFSRLLASNQIVLLNAPGVAAVALDELLQGITGEVLVISPTLAFASCFSNEAQVCRLREFVDGGTSLDVSGKIIVIQDASMLDLLTARKLLRNIAGAAKLVLIGDRKMLPPFGPGHIFPGLARSNVVPSIDTTKHLKSSSFPTPLIGLPAILSSNAGLRPIVEMANHVPVDTMEELMSVALAQYRAVFEQNPSEGIIIASTRALATSLNETLHQEVLDYAVSQGGDNPSISLQSKQPAAVGDNVIYMSRDFRRGLFHGSRGLVTEIFPVAARNNRRNPAAVARIEFDTAGPLDVTARDCQSMMLGHAVQVHHASMSRWRKVIIAAAPSQNFNNSWVWRSATRAVEQLVIVDLRHAFQAALTTEVRDTAYVPLSDWNPQ
ncbi:helix-hairpin-helix domain-containing protein [Paraburkholderia youngii]|uniref:helix-hairpin-helix domain-containing protein n=1 Tax=Paraburkholderia youngii TaxID=2782701 RepID=UPI003D222814